MQPPLLAALVAVALVVLHGVVVVSILSAERRQPAATLSWLLAVTFVPVLGLVLYALIGTTRARALRVQGRESAALTAAALARLGVRRPCCDPYDPAYDERTAALLKLCERLSSSPAAGGNRVTHLVNGAATYRSMIAAIEAARSSIHVQFYIIQPDATGRALVERLAARAREGLRVRVLVDAAGSGRLPRGFFAPLLAAGGRAAAFNPIGFLVRRLRRADRIDFRNHRKIVVVDGRVAFTGGINVGREYLGLDPALGHWRDTHLRIEGPAALALQEVFARDWLLASGEPVAGPEWFPPLEEPLPGQALVQIVDSGPESPFSPLALIHAQALAAARERVFLTTPYFIPSETIAEALMAAALRGVDVRLLLPGKSDNRVVTLASRSYYRPLLEAGVRIFEYQWGFVHAKTLVVDSWLGTVGSANMDLRSFLLNFEVCAWVFGPELAEELTGQFRLDLAEAREVTLETLRKQPLIQWMGAQAARLLSPLL
jgi:cardiolipin synthase